MADNQNTLWERETIEKLLFATLKEQRRRRRWGLVLKLLLIIYLFAFLYWIWSDKSTSITGDKSKPHASLIEIHGEIGDSTSASAKNIIMGLRKAYKDKNTKGIILDIDSPGGSPVQAADVFDEITYLRNTHKNIKIYTVCSDVCASAAYLIASSTDDIYANPSSLVGSIGVLMDGFGFVDTIKKLGIERRLITAGSHKGFLDPFSPLKPDDEKLAQALLDNVHAQFIQKVQEGRGTRLKNNPDLYSGLVWTGNQGLTMGLIDGYGNMYSVTRDIIRSDNIVNYTVKQSVFSQFTHRMGTAFSQELAQQLGLIFSGIK